MRLLALAFGVALGAQWGAPAEARMHAPYRGHRIVPVATAPLDNFATPAAAYSLRKLKSSYSGPGIKLRRASDSATQDINFLGFTSFSGAPLDVAAANAFCNATTCTVDTWYDQSGNGRHSPQANPAQQPLYAADCGAGQPCLRTTAGQIMGGASVTPAAAGGSFSGVARTDATPALCTIIQASSEQIAMNAGNWIVYNGAASIGRAATLAAWHAGNGVIAGAASVLNVDGGETAGTVAPVTTTGIMIAPGGDGSNPCSFAEAVWWDGYALTAGERAALVANQRSYWGF